MKEIEYHVIVEMITIVVIVIEGMNVTVEMKGEMIATKKKEAGAVVPLEVVQNHQMIDVQHHLLEVEEIYQHQTGVVVAVVEKN